MDSLIQKLRNREVFRTAGLYIGIVWILIECASIILPIFEAPAWLMQAIVIAAFVGLPITLILAWIFNITEHGVEVDHESAEIELPDFKNRKMDFIVIGILLVALIFSVNMNISNVSEPVVQENVSILIADFDNQTNNPLFEEVLEMALNVGVESAPYIYSYRRDSARNVAKQIQKDATELNADMAQLVAIKEGVGLVLLGSIANQGNKFEISIKGIEPVSGNELFKFSREAKSSSDVLEAVGKLAKKVRENLGDDSLANGSHETFETFTAISLEAAQLYSKAARLAIDGNNEEAIVLLKRVIELDPNFSRAYATWALSEFYLGREEKAAKLWQESLARMGQISERERLRTLGVYYVNVTRNYEKAKEIFLELVRKYPSDMAGHNNLAVVAFYLLDFDLATAEGKIVLDLYPMNSLFRSNFALYAMYSGNFSEAADMAQSLIDDEPDYGTGYIPVAMAHLDSGDVAQARETYTKMAKATSTQFRESTAKLGLADIEIYYGNFSKAREILTQAIESDLSEDKVHHAAVKFIALAQTEYASGHPDEALASASEALNLSNQDSILVGAANVFIDIGATDKAEQIATNLSAKLQKQSRAYSLMIQASLKRTEGHYVEAFELLGSAAQLADLWLIRFEFGKTYLEAEYFVEALDEFVTCNQMRGQATAVFLDDLPSYRYLATLPYWIARAQQGLGNKEAAIQGYQRFIALRPEGGTLASDAQSRME